jgi:membrane-associated protease RseP (regulator of RpoE activity)
MEKKEIKIELDKQTNPWKWVAIILIALVVVDLSCLSGAIAGGFAGYVLGRKTAGPPLIYRHDFDFPMVPEIPEMPEHPWVPRYPLPPEEPRFDMPSIPESGNRPRLGVTFVMKDDGAEIVAVTPGSPAEEVGIQVGDVITKVNGRRVTRVNPLNELILMYEPGDVVSLTIERDGHTRQIEVKLAAEPLG